MPNGPCNSCLYALLLQALVIHFYHHFVSLSSIIFINPYRQNHFLLSLVINVIT
jgi:hypothetical protein